MVVVFITTLYLCNQCLSPLTLWVRTRSWRGVFDTTLCDQVCLRLTTGRWFSHGTPVSSTNKTDRHDITDILLKVAINIITLTMLPNVLPLDNATMWHIKHKFYLIWQMCHSYADAPSNCATLRIRLDLN
jgi:hypothetical protein